jgi:micrococcal nuclease
MVWLVFLFVAAFVGFLVRDLSRPARPKEVGAVRPDVKAVSPCLSGRCVVVDGDTIIIGGKPIRLAGIDAPELDHPYGVKAKWALVGLCRGQTVRAELDGSSSYDRLVAICYLPDGRDLAAEMVRLGHAVDWRKYSGGRYRHLEVAGIRKRLWRCDARQKGRFPPAGSARTG